LLALCGLIALFQSASAETLVLVQGYLASGASWRESGVTEVLEAAGWDDGGGLVLCGPRVCTRHGKATGARRFYTLELPTEAPLLMQAGLLARYIEHLEVRHPGTEFVLVGHSAGGVVARAFMVQHPKVRVSALITIASPHLGTESAELGNVVGRSPLAWFAPLVGAGTLNRSQALYRDLARERPNNLLGWLNHQPHPDAIYVSIVRTQDDETFGVGDLLVPAWSQDMSRVYGLAGRARTLAGPGGHGLGKDDGRLLLRILERLQRV
jgi:pimeloyl-ACP methyl ester carboxylesterase